jgi:hypothetical protein
MPLPSDAAADAAVTAILRRLEKAGVARQVLADMTDAEQAAVFAAEARATSSGRTPK